VQENPPDRKRNIPVRAPLWRKTGAWASPCGGWAGSGIGAGSGNAAAIVGGVILGSLIGNALEVEATRRPGVELTVRLDAGRTIAVVQDAVPGEAFRPGDRIRVVSDGYRTRIVY